jgi:hypothetical protein
LIVGALSAGETLRVAGVFLVEEEIGGLGASDSCKVASVEELNRTKVIGSRVGRYIETVPTWFQETR